MKKTRVGLILGALLLMAAACATEGYNKGEFNIMSVEQEDEWGKELKTKVDQELVKEGMELNDPVVQNYVDNLGRKLLANAPEVKFDYTFTAVKTDVVNAFAIPGGHVYIHTALIAEADNEAELAGVMAHEIGHVVARHSSERLSAIYAAATVGSILVNTRQEETDRMLTDLAVQLVTTGGMLAYSRANENEADKIGAEIMYNAGYNPYGMVDFFEKMHERTGDMNDVQVFLSTHPDPRDREGRVKDHIEDELGDVSNLKMDSAEFVRVRSRVRAIKYPEKED